MLEINITTVGLFIAIIFFVFIIIKIYSEIKDNYEDKTQDDYTLALVDKIRKISPEVDNVVDKLKFYQGKKSYTINKKHVYLCKYDENNKLYDENQLILVLIHEIAHSLCPEVGHTDKFNQIFDGLLDKAEVAGIYDPNIPHVQNYCPGPEIMD